MKGKVFLIGAGCADFDLITIRGLNRLRESEVVLYDSLVDTRLPDCLSENVEKIYVGKRYNKNSLSQDEINNLLLVKANEGKIVARLKGGDPYVFGRGSEEALFLQSKEVEYEVISGVSSAIAVPAAAGIPVTHRQLSRSLTIITGSTADESSNSLQIDYKALTNLNGTIVILMGYHHINEILKGFLDAGMNKNMPCAIISRGCSANQKIIKGDISNILSKICNEPEFPIIIVIGKCVDLNLNETAYSNLVNTKIGVVATESFVKKIRSKYQNKQRNIIDLGFLDVAVFHDPLPELSKYNWIVFTSQNGVEQFFSKLKSEGKDVRLLHNLKFASIGSGTSEKLLEYGIYADFIPSIYNSSTLAKEFLRKLVSNDNVLICRASKGSDVLIEALKKNNYKYTDYKIYELKENEIKKNLVFSSKKKIMELDYLIFASAFNAESFLKNLDFILQSNTKIVCMGVNCFRQFKDYKQNKILIPKKYDIDGVIECIEADLSKG